MFQLGHNYENLKWLYKNCKSNLFDSGRGGSSKPHSSSSETSIITNTIFEGVPLIDKKEYAQRPLGALISKNSLSKSM